MGTIDDTPAVQQLPDQLAERRKRRETGSSRRAQRQPLVEESDGHLTPPPGANKQKPPRRWRGGIGGGLDFDEPHVDEVLDALATRASTSSPPVDESEANGTDLDHASGGSIEVDDGSPAGAPVVDDWLRTYYERQHRQLPSTQTAPRGSAELQAAVVAPKRRRPTEPRTGAAKPSITTRAGTSPGTRPPRRGSPTMIRWAAGAGLVVVVLVVAVVLIWHITGGGSPYGSRAPAREAASGTFSGWQGNDPRSALHPSLPVPVKVKVSLERAAASPAAAHQLDRLVTRVHSRQRSAPAAAPITYDSSEQADMTTKDATSAAGTTTGSAQQVATTAQTTTYTPAIPANSSSASTSSSSSDSGPAGPTGIGSAGTNCNPVCK